MPKYMKPLYGLCLLFFCGALTSCVGRYRAVQADKIEISLSQQADNFDFGYKWGVMAEAGNRRAARKEAKKGLHIVAVKYVNRSKRMHVFGRDVVLLSNGLPVSSLPPIEAKKLLRQNLAPYIGYVILTPVYEIVFRGGLQEYYTKVGLAVGPGIALTHMAIANGANNRFYQNLVDSDLHLLEIAPGETVYGLVAVPSLGVSNLSVEVK